MHSGCMPSKVIKTLSQIKPAVNFNKFVLAGGTALALQIGHRISVDLDFFKVKEFSTESIYRDFRKTGLEPAIQQEEKGTLTVIINGVKISMFHYPYKFIDKTIRFKDIPVAGIIDIASMKMVAIAQRGSKRDFVDLFFILRDVPFRKIAENMVIRFGRNRINPVIIGKSMIYFNDADTDPDPVYCGRIKPAWKDIESFFVKNTKQMVIDIENAIKS